MIYWMPFLVIVAFLVAGFFMIEQLSSDGAFGLFIAGLASLLFVCILVGTTKGQHPDPWMLECIKRGGTIEKKYVKPDGHDPSYYDTCTYGK